MRIRIPLLVAVASAALAACTTDGYGVGLDVGYNDPLYDPADCWSSGFYNYNYVTPYCGWYDGYFYPGSGYWIYDRGHHRHHWDGSQQAYWTRQGRTPDGGHTVGLGSSGGVRPPSVGGIQPHSIGPVLGSGTHGFGDGGFGGHGGFGGGRGGFGGFDGGQGGFGGGHGGFGGGRGGFGGGFGGGRGGFGGGFGGGHGGGGHRG